MSSVSFSSDVTQSDYYKCSAVPSVERAEIRTEWIKTGTSSVERSEIRMEWIKTGTSSVKQVEIRTELIKLTALVRKNGRITDINIRLMIQSTDWQFLQMEDLPRHKR